MVERKADVQAHWTRPGVLARIDAALAELGVPTANSKRLTATANRLILAADERSLQVDLVRLDRNIPTAGCVASLVHE